jgi:hypothetical protein
VTAVAIASAKSPQGVGQIVHIPYTLTSLVRVIALS